MVGGCDARHARSDDDGSPPLPNALPAEPRRRAAAAAGFTAASSCQWDLLSWHAKSTSSFHTPSRNDTN